MNKKGSAVYIYGDIVIGINFIMNSLILILTAYVAGIEFRYNRIGAAAFLGGLYSLGEIEPQLAFLYSIPLKLAAAAIIIYLAFGYKTLKSFGLTAVIFFIVSFVLAGAVVGWTYFLESRPLAADGMRDSLSFNFIGLAAGTFLAVGFIFLAGKWIAEQLFRRKNSYLFTLKYKNREFSGLGFLDTGNGLYSPLGGTPVILLVKEACLKILPPKAAAYLEKYSQNEWVGNLDACQDEEWLSRIEIIPYMTVNQADSGSLLLAFRPDGISIFAEEGEMTSSKVIVAISETIFDKRDNLSALLHPGLINELNLKKEAAGICVLPGRQ